MAHLRYNTTAKTKILKLAPVSKRFLPLVVVISAGFGSVALAQDWIPHRCCPATDCQQSTPIRVNEVRGGYTIEGVEGVVLYDDPRVKPSMDGRFHTCIRSQARPYMKQTDSMIAGQQKELKCLFVPLLG